MGLIHGGVRPEGRADSREDRDQRLDDRPPNGLLVTHHSLVFKVQQSVS